MNIVSIEHKLGKWMKMGMNIAINGVGALISKQTPIKTKDKTERLDVSSLVVKQDKWE